MVKRDCNGDLPIREQWLAKPSPVEAESAQFLWRFDLWLHDVEGDLSGGGEVIAESRKCCEAYKKFEVVCSCS